MQSDNSWKILGDRVVQPSPFLVMGILNITPNSFYDGGIYDSEFPATQQARTLFDQGADIVDMGGESTRPFSERVSLEEERNRVLPVLDNIRQELSDPLISVDTYKADMARDALEAGASVINDVSACSLDPGLRDVVADYKPGYILMHSKGRPENMQKDPCYDDVIGEIKEFFEQKLKDLTSAGLPEENIVLDPGIGFGKTLEHNLTIMKNVREFLSLGRPLFAGLSNKSVWQKLLGLAPEERGNVTQVATALMAERGVCMHRVHEVDLTVQTLEVVRQVTEVNSR